MQGQGQSHGNDLLMGEAEGKDLSCTEDVLIKARIQNGVCGCALFLSFIPLKKSGGDMGRDNSTSTQMIACLGQHVCVCVIR
jgi:hypothetical protein